jgi:thiol-disulfide isomerase/thioredoxin
MKKVFLLSVLIFGFFVVASAQTKLPNVDIKTLDGKTVHLADYGKSGKVTVISFWATWCTPCKKELDVMSEVYSDWKEKYNMELLAITIDNARALPKVPSLIETKGWEFPVLAGDQNAMQTAFSFQTIPQTFLLDKSGTIVWSHSGYVPGDELELEDRIKTLAAK